MGEAAQLITAIAALVTAIGGAVAGVIVALGSLRKQRSAAAEEAVRLAPDHRGRHELDERARFLREFTSEAKENAHWTAELARDQRWDGLLDRNARPQPPPTPGVPPVPDPEWGADG